jgi:hypothetical protein
MGAIRRLLNTPRRAVAVEAAEFDTRTPHWFSSPGPEPAEVLMLFGPQGERMHLRARPRSGH